MRRRFAPVAAALLLLVGTGALARADDPPAEPAGYRLDDYRTVTPLTVLGHRALDTAEAERLWRNGAAFIDVLPAPRRPANLPATAIWAPRPRLSIPGSLWLPDVGRGALSPELEAWFRAELDRITKGDRGAALVFFCLADCWMSWNAAKRALEWGFAGAEWYRDGTEAWSFADLPLAPIAPPADLPH